MNTIKLRKKSTLDFCVLIPVLNEGLLIMAQLERMQNLSCDIVIVDGGSTDGSIERIIKSDFANVIRIIQTYEYKGLSKDLYLGLIESSQDYKYVVTIDGNNKDSTQSIPEMVRFVQENALAFCQGSRWLKNGNSKGLPLDRFLLIRFFIAPWISFWARRKYSDPTNQFRVYNSSELLKILPANCNFKRYDFFFWLPIAITRLTALKTGEFPVDRSYPEDGTIPTKISRSKFPRLGIDLFKIGIRWKSHIDSPKDRKTR